MWGIVQKDSIDRLIQKIRNLTTRVETLESSGGGTITLAGDVIGNSSLNTVAQIANIPIISVPDTNGQGLIYDNNDVNLIWGVPSISNIETFISDGNINNNTQLVIVDLTGIGTLVTLTLPNIRKHMQLIYIKLIGQGSIAKVTLNSGGASNGFDYNPLSGPVLDLTNNGVGTVMILCGDLTNNCWWVLGINYV